jgi:beta-cyclopiazonate dehydrogenase
LTAVDFGVAGYIDLPGTEAFFNRFGLSMIKVKPPMDGSGMKGVDFVTGQVVAPAYKPEETQAAMAKWIELCDKYIQYMEVGLNLPASGEDLAVLAMPFGEFARKHGIEAVVNTLWSFHNYADMLNEPTLYVMANSGSQQLKALMPGFDLTFMVAASHNNSILYSKIRDALGDAVLLNSQVVAAKREEGQAAILTVQTPEGAKTIKAKTILMAAPPTLDTLRGFDLDDEEKSVFGKWQSVNFYVGVLTNTGVPPMTRLVGYTADTNKLNVPDSPGILQLSSMTPGALNFMVLGDSDFTPEAAREILVDGFRKANQTGALGAGPVEPEIAAWAAHAPSMFTVSSKEISCGFYSRLSALQGRHGTFYAGNALTPDKTSNVWLHVEQILKDSRFN